MKSLLVLSLVAAFAGSHAQSMCGPMPESKSIVALPAGTMIDGIGTCDLPVTTKNEKVRKLVHQGFALIHCFWFNEATRSFRDATKEDPTCATAWLGLSISLTLPWNQPSEFRPEADYASKRAVDLCGDASDVEQALIAAFRLRSSGVDDRESQFEKAMARLIVDHPNEFEPRLLIAAIRVQICMGDGYDREGNLRDEMKQVMGWMDPILKKDPKHAGALHYKIHALESHRPQDAVGAARQLSLSAPGSSHMVHMPGHIFNRVGLFKDAQKSFSDSKSVDDKYYKRIPGSTDDTNWNYGHNMAYMAANLAEMGRLKEAIAADPESKDDFYWRAAMWSQITKADPFFTGMTAIATDTEAAVKQAEALEASIPAQQPRRSWSLTQHRVKQVKALELRGMILSAKGDHEGAIEKLRNGVAIFRTIAYDEPPYYVRLPHESLGEALTKAGRYNEAIQAYKDGLFYRPNSGWLLYGIALAHELAGHKDAAAIAYGEFLAAWSTADRDLPQVKHAMAVAKA